MEFFWEPILDIYFILVIISCACTLPALADTDDPKTLRKNILGGLGVSFGAPLLLGITFGGVVLLCKFIKRLYTGFFTVITCFKSDITRVLLLGLKNYLWENIHSSSDKNVHENECFCG